MSRSSSAMFRNFFSHLGPRILVLFFSLFSGVLVHNPSPPNFLHQEMSVITIDSENEEIRCDCGPPPVLKYAKPYDPIKSVYKPYESVVYKCLPDHEEDPNKPFIATCFPDKGWNTLEEFCERGCESPQETRFSVVSDDDFLYFYPVGSVVHHICHRSAEHILGHPKRPAITCLSNYTWTSVPVFCKGQSCGDPGKPENGNRIILTDFLLKANINFTCNEGYQLIGSPTSRCLSHSLSNNTVVWKPKPPTCFRPTCPPPPEIKNGTYTGGKNGTFPLNSNVTYICDLGFSLSGGDLLHCITEDNKTGIWRGSVPECKGDCPRPDLPLHSSLKGGGSPEDTYSTGTTLRLQCIPGYENIPGILPTMSCLDTSKWSDLPTFCQGKRCRVPNIENGKIVSSNDLRLGEEVTLGCNYGFRMIGGITRQCVLKSGTVDWNRELPTCERIPCSRPPVIANGIYDPNPSDLYDAGWTVIYRCDPDYSLIGNSTITCIVAENGVDGKWDLPSPECKKVKCHRPSIPNGNVASVFQATYTYQHKLQIECNPGYTLLGSSSIQCGTDSQWKPSLPRCDKIPTTSKPTKPPTPAVPSTPPIPPRPGTVSPEEDGTEATAGPPTTTQTTPKDEPGSGNVIGIAVGAVIAVLIILAAVIFVAVKKFSVQGKANTHPASTDDYHVVSEKDMALEPKSKN